MPEGSDIYPGLIGDLPQGGRHYMEARQYAGDVPIDRIERFVFPVDERSIGPLSAPDLCKLSMETGLLLGSLGMPERVELVWNPDLADYDNPAAVTPPPLCVPNFSAKLNERTYERTYTVEAALPLTRKVTGFKATRGLGMSVAHYEVQLPRKGFMLWPVRVTRAERHFWVGDDPRQVVHTYPLKMTPLGALIGLHEALRELRHGVPFGGGDGTLSVNGSSEHQQWPRIKV